MVLSWTEMLINLELGTMVGLNPASERDKRKHKNDNINQRGQGYDRLECDYLAVAGNPVPVIRVAHHEPSAANLCYVLGLGWQRGPGEPLGLLPSGGFLAPHFGVEFQVDLFGDFGGGRVARSRESGPLPKHHFADVKISLRDWPLS